MATVKAMKHAIEVGVLKKVFKKINYFLFCLQIVSHKDSTSYVRISQFMKFLMSIIRLLEQRPTMMLHEIKNALDCSISTTFEFGYPNLYTLLSAYPDIFCLTLGVSQERSEVTLLASTEMRLSSFSNHKHLFGSIKLPFNKQKNSLRSTRSILSEHNGRATAAGNSGPPPAKTRALSSDATAYTPLGNYNSAKTSGCSTNNMRNNSSNTSTNFYHSMSRTSNKNYGHNSSSSFNNLSGSSSSYSSASSGHHSNFLNTSGSGSNNMSHSKDNSFNSSFLFSNSFNSSGNTSGSYCDLNSSMNSMITGAVLTGSTMQHQPMHMQQQQAAMSQIYQPNGTKLWDRRHTAGNFYNQPTTASGLAPLVLPPPQQLIGAAPTLSGIATALQNQQHNSILPNASSETSSGLFELVNNMKMCPIYEPPKPDTPPSEVSF